MSRYHVLASDDLMATDGLLWPEGMRPVQQEPTDPGRYPGMHWWLIEDDDAPPELEGERVELTFAAILDNDGDPVGSEIAARRVVKAL